MGGGRGGHGPQSLEQLVWIHTQTFHGGGPAFEQPGKFVARRRRRFMVVAGGRARSLDPPRAGGLRLNAVTECVFCHADDRILHANMLAFATRDNHPVSDGHTLIVPRRHTADVFDLTPEEAAACFTLAREVRDRLAAGPRPPDGYNLGVNVGVAGGQSVMHVHFHLLPRYAGDVADPRGGVRNILPHRHCRS